MSSESTFTCMGFAGGVCIVEISVFLSGFISGSIYTCIAIACTKEEWRWGEGDGRKGMEGRGS